jgi:GNAT superfamily N-acetyltransferase
VTTGTKSAEIDIRDARLEDSTQLAELSGQLGYPSTAEQIRQRLKAIADFPESAIFVAASGNTVAGFVGVQVLHTLEADQRVEVTALVVLEEFRSQGVGKLLMARAEEWARSQRCTIIGLRSNVIRERAHSFYQRLGYEHLKTQKAFRKSL